MKNNVKIEKGDVVRYRLEGQDPNYGFVMDTYDLGEFRTETDGVINESDVKMVYKDQNNFGRDLADLYNKRPFDCYDMAVSLLNAMQMYKEFLTKKK